MARWMWVLALVGCDGTPWEGLRLGGSLACEYSLEVVDSASGSVQVETSEEDCEQREAPNSVTYVMLLDEQGEPLDERNPLQLCNTGYIEILQLDDLTVDELSIDPTGELPGRVTVDSRDEAILGAWMQVSFEDREGGGSTAYPEWSAFFQFGEPDSGVSATTCEATRL